MGPGEDNEADTVSLVRHLTEGNGLHEYFMGFGCIFPHFYNLFVLLEVRHFMSHVHSNLEEFDIQTVFKKIRLVVLIKLKFVCDTLTQTLKQRHTFSRFHCNLVTADRWEV